MVYLPTGTAQIDYALCHRYDGLPIQALTWSDSLLQAAASIPGCFSGADRHRAAPRPCPGGGVGDGPDTVVVPVSHDQNGAAVGQRRVR